MGKRKPITGREVMEKCGVSMPKAYRLLNAPDCPDEKDEIIPWIEGRLARGQQPREMGMSERQRLDMRHKEAQIRRLDVQTEEARQRIIEDAYTEFFDTAQRILSTLGDVPSKCKLTKAQAKSYTAILDGCVKRMEKECNG